MTMDQATSSRRRPSPVRTALLAALALAVAGCGGGSGSRSGAGTQGSAPATTEARAGAPTTTGSAPKAAARWETLDTLTGTGAAQRTITVFSDAIQWRARYSCQAGTLRVMTDPPPRRPAPLVDATRCPQEGEGYSIATGQVKLDIQATGPWQLVIDQQLERPLDEPPLAGMVPAAKVASGTFFPVEKTGKGTATLYRLPDGRRAIRFEGFETAENTDLFVWIASARSAKTSADAVSAPYRVIANLKSTVGNENYELPADLPDNEINAVVIWCEPVKIAYAIAQLAR